MNAHTPPLLMDLAQQCRAIVIRAREDLGEIPRAALLDLVADNIPDVPLRTLQDALVCAGVGY